MEKKLISLGSEREGAEYLFRLLKARFLVGQTGKQTVHPQWPTPKQLTLLSELTLFHYTRRNQKLLLATHTRTFKIP